MWNPIIGDLVQLECTVESVVQQFAIGWRINIIRSDHLILCTTKPTKLLEVETLDCRVNFLKTILHDGELKMQDSEFSTSEKMEVQLDTDESLLLSNPFLESIPWESENSINDAATTVDEVNSSISTKLNEGKHETNVSSQKKKVELWIRNTLFIIWIRYWIKRGIQSSKEKKVHSHQWLKILQS